MYGEIAISPMIQIAVSPISQTFAAIVFLLVRSVRPPEKDDVPITPAAVCHKMIPSVRIDT